MNKSKRIQTTSAMIQIFGYWLLNHQRSETAYKRKIYVPDKPSLEAFRQSKQRSAGKQVALFYAEPLSKRDKAWLEVFYEIHENIKESDVKNKAELLDRLDIALLKKFHPTKPQKTPLKWI